MPTTKGKMKMKRPQYETAAEFRARIAALITGERPEPIKRVHPLLRRGPKDPGYNPPPKKAADAIAP